LEGKDFVKLAVRSGGWGGVLGGGSSPMSGLAEHNTWGEQKTEVFASSGLEGRSLWGVRRNKHRDFLSIFFPRSLEPITAPAKGGENFG